MENAKLECAVYIVQAILQYERPIRNDVLIACNKVFRVLNYWDEDKSVWKDGWRNCVLDAHKSFYEVSYQVGTCYEDDVVWKLRESILSVLGEML